MLELTLRPKKGIVKLVSNAIIIDVHILILKYYSLFSMAIRPKIQLMTVQYVKISLDFLC